jgi:serine/threonine protein kinase
MGEVMICKDNHLDRKVVIKKLQAGVEGRRIVDEHKALAKLRSKHVVQLYDIIQIGGPRSPETAIVLEYIEGKDLDFGIYGAGEEYLRMLWQIASGIRDIHAAGIIHRDIKPENVRVDSEGVAKIIDFGLARDGESSRTRNIVGTPGFMAPELWGDGVVSFDKSIDVYAFGVMCLALVTTKFPRALTLRPPKVPSRIDIDTILTGIPHDLVDIVYSCLHSLPKERPSMGKVVFALERHLLRGKHRALVVMDGKEHWLGDQKRHISLRAAENKLRIEYDGFDFKVANVEGDIKINNQDVEAGEIIPGCCVIGFGRTFVTFDKSHPEVMA